MIRQNKKPHVSLFLAVTCIAASAACSFDGKSGEREASISSPPQTAQPMRQACDGLFGEPGMKALSKLSGGHKFFPRSSSARNNLKRLANRMKSASPSLLSDGSENATTVCNFIAPAEQEFSKKTVKLRYGWSNEPKKSDKGHVYYTAGSALVDAYARDLKTPTLVYFTCRLSQNRVGIVRGGINADWPVQIGLDKAQAQVAALLLATAQEMSDQLGCKNDVELDPTSKVTRLLEDSGSRETSNQPLPRLPESGPLVKGAG